MRGQVLYHGDMRHFKKFFFIAIVFVLGFYVYKNILPFQLPNQYQPTEEDIKEGGIYDNADEQGVFHGKKTLSNAISEPEDTVQVSTNVLGQQEAFKRIEVDLTNQRVYAFEGTEKVMEFVVSTGKWGRTPTGVFKIEYKTRAQKMSGGSKELNTYYYLPNVPYVQFFGNEKIPWSRGFSFHGTYWHTNFGQPMSHGCVNMKTEDAEKLYYWTTPILEEKNTVKASSENPGTLVIIYGTTPRG